MVLKTVKHNTVRMGVVGCGVVSSYGHIPAIAQSEDAELVAFADPNKERLQAEMAKYDKPGYASFEDMLACEELDAVAIPTHPDIKLDLCRLAAKNGLHVFCEKPLTNDEAQAKELVQLMDDRGLFVGMSFVYRGKKVVQRMMALVADGAIGQVKAVHLQNFWDYHGLRDEAVRGDRRRRALANLGTLDCGVHHLDLARYLSGSDFKILQAMGDIVECENTFPDHIVVQARMENGTLVTIDESAVYGHTAQERPVYAQSYCLIGDNGVLSADLGKWGETCELYVISKGKQWRETVGTDKAWDETYHQFFQTILGRAPESPFIANGRDGLINMQVAREIITQCEAGMNG